MALQEQSNFQTPFKLEHLKQVENFALNDLSLLIVGEPGTGKTVMAHLIHHQSARRSYPFVHVNCAAMAEDLLDIELFGYEKRADSGEILQKVGQIEYAHQGILVLSEISELPLRLQTKLSRALQSQEIYKIGSSSPIPINVRVISTTHSFLEEKVHQGLFRPDLYHILTKAIFFIPSLRARPLDIELLTAYFLDKFSIVLEKKQAPLISDEAKNILNQHAWPGNIRELEHLIYRLVSCTDEIKLEEKDLKNAGFSLSVTESSFKKKDKSTVSYYVGQTIAEVEKRLILKTLESCLGNKTKAATLLGISIRTLRNKLHQYLPEQSNYDLEYHLIQIGK